MYPFNASNLNNSRPTYIKAEPTDHNYPRDPKYYYPDGNAVFLVEGILFKLHASLVLGVDLGRTRTSEGHTQRYPTEATNLPDEVTDSSDTSPIAILNVTSLQFHRFLFTVFGLPSDPEYLAFLTDPRDPKKHNRDLLTYHYDVAYVARRFGMLTLENWAQLQILLVLESVNELARGRWDYDSLLGLVLYAYSTGNQYLISSTTTFIQYFVSTAVDGNRAGRAISSRLITCLRLYKCAKIRDEAPALFGCLFVFILSLGHTSPAWTSYLTREDRATLYAAQAHLTVICQKLENTRWLTTDQPEEYFKWICDRCKPHLLPVWKGTIGSLSGKLTSKLPLEDITLLARLPQYRQAFRTKLDQIKVPSASETCHYQHSHTVFRPTEADRGPLTRAEHTCLESPRKMTEVDRLIQNVFSNLAGKHDYFSL